MVIRSVLLSHIRNHVHTELHCAGDVNVLSGPNGSGKTSVLEAISLCAVAKTFVPVPDHALIQQGMEDCSVTTVAMRDLDVPYRVTVSMGHGIRKRIVTSHATQCSPRDIIGEMPIVALSPDHKGITFGAPSERRAFLDGVMAQSSKRYTELLYEHRRVLKQRNSVLQQARGHAPAELDVWTQQLIHLSAEITERRARFLIEITPLIKQCYATVSGNAENISIEYQPDICEHGFVGSVSDVSRDVLVGELQNIASGLRSRELVRETTLFGPQKDEVRFLINGGLVRETASQGQHKSLLVALKLAECSLLHARCNERPIVLLDDVFSELDRERCEHVLLEILNSGMQCFISTTNGREVMDMLHALGAQRSRQLESTLHSLSHAEAA